MTKKSLFGGRGIGVILTWSSLFSACLFSACAGYCVVLDEQAPAQEDHPSGSRPEALALFHEERPTPPPAPEYLPGEVLVKFKEGAVPGSLLKEERIEAQGIARIHSIAPAVANFRKDYKLERTSASWYSFLGKNYKETDAIPEEEAFKMAYSAMPETQRALYRSYRVKLPEGMSVEEAVAKLASNPLVEQVVPNHIVTLQAAPDDPYYSSSRSWGQPYDDLWGIKKIQCERAWETSQGEGVVVAVIDTGVDYNHEDLAQNIWVNANEVPGNNIDDDRNGYVDDVRGWDFSNNDNDPMDDHGHGTHVSGTIAAAGNNGIGVVGVAPKAKIMPVKGIKRDGIGYSSALAACVVYAADNGAKVLNNSWGEPFPMELFVLKDAFDYAHARQVVSVAAAGNTSYDARFFFPAGLENVICVAATNPNDERCHFSNYGPKIDVSAPGGDTTNSVSNILSTMGDGTLSGAWPELKVSPGYYRLAGTSMASPHVAGLAALILEEYKTATPEEVRTRIRASVDEYPQVAVLPLGTGRINAYQALTAQPKPFIRIEDVHVQELEGNGNQIPESNERVALYVKLQNIWIGAGAVQAEFQAADPSIASISVNAASFGSIGAGETKENTANPFIFNISAIQYEKAVIGTLVIHADAHRQEIRFWIRLGVRRLAKDVKCKFTYTNPYIWRNKVVWSAVAGSEKKNHVFVYDLESNELQQVTRGLYDHEAFGIDQNRVVYSSQRPSPVNPESGETHLYAYDLTTNQEIQITRNSGSAPPTADISGSKIVWQDWRNSSSDVYMYDLDTNTETRVPGFGARYVPKISGDKIAWSSMSGASLYNLTTQRTQEFNSPTGIFSKPDITDRSLVYCWDPKLRLYDLATGQDTELGITATDPSIEGDIVVWRDSRNISPDSPNNVDLYAYDGQTGQEKQLTSFLTDQLTVDLDERQAVWFDRDQFSIYLIEISPRVAHPPVLNPIGDKTVRARAVLRFVVSGSDPDGDDLTFAASGLPPGASFRNNQFLWRPSDQQEGTFSVVFTVSDGKLSDSEQIRVVVTPLPNRAPVLIPIRDRTVQASAQLRFQVAGFDLDRDPLTFDISGLPAGAGFVDSQFRWIPTSAQVGTHTMTFTVTDGKLSDSEQIRVVVRPSPNQPPVLLPIRDKTVRAGALLRFHVLGFDLDWDALTFGVSGLPAGARFADNQFRWIPSSAQVGSHTVTFTLSDGNLGDSEQIRITVRSN